MPAMSLTTSAWPERDPVLIDRGTTDEKELAQFLGVKIVVSLAIESQADATAGIEPRLEVVEKKRPLFRAPELRTFMPVEANHEGRDEIELAIKRRERLERLDARDDALEPERMKHFPKHRHVTGLKSEGAMPKPIANVEKKAGAGAGFFLYICDR